MSYELYVDVPGGKLRITDDTQKGLIKQASFFQNLPTKCPVDGSDAVFYYKNPDDYEYYGLISTGEGRKYEYKCGQHKDGGTLFGKGIWTYWDGQQEIIVWPVESKGQTMPPPSNGTMTPHQKLVVELDRLGMLTFPADWGNKVRAHNVNRISNGRTQDANELTDEELERLINGLQLKGKK